MDSEFPLWVERSLITMTLLFSAILVLATVFLTKFERSRDQFFVVCVGVSGCIISVLTGLVLFLIGRMSLDAFGVILIGLLPALEATGRVRIGMLYLEMRKRCILHNRIQELKYLRHGRSPMPGSLGQDNCNATTYLRQPASSINDLQSEPQYSIWKGHVLDFDHNIIRLVDFNDDGQAVRWWKAANEAVEVAKDPRKLRLGKRRQATRALELIAEISIIGDSLLEYHGSSLRNFAKRSRKLRQGLSATPATVCRAIMEAVGLSKEWGPVDEAVLDDFTSNTEGNRGKQYGMLFFVLLNESDLFQRVNDKFDDGRKLADAEHIIQCFQETSEPAARKTSLSQWLHRYGLSHARLAKYDDSYMPELKIPLPCDSSRLVATPEVVLDTDGIPSDASGYILTRATCNSGIANGNEECSRSSGQVQPSLGHFISQPIRFVVPRRNTGPREDAGDGGDGTNMV